MYDLKRRCIITAVLSASFNTIDLNVHIEMYRLQRFCRYTILSMKRRYCSEQANERQAVCIVIAESPL